MLDGQSDERVLDGLDRLWRSGLIAKAGREQGVSVMTFVEGGIICPRSMLAAAAWTWGTTSKWNQMDTARRRA